MARWVRAARAADLGPGMSLGVTLDGAEVALFNVGGMLYALDNACKHQGGPLAEGALEGTIVTCPWHAWPFDVTTGALVDNPAIAQTTYPVEIRGDDVYLEMP